MSLVRSGTSAERQPITAGEPPLPMSLRLIFLIGLVYAVASVTHPGLHGKHLVATVLTATTALGWLTWLAARQRNHNGASIAGVVVLASSGGALVVIHPIGVAVAGVAALCAASRYDIVPALAMAVPSIAVAGIAVALSGHHAGAIANAASGAAAGVVIGVSRRQSQQRAVQAAELAMARDRSQLEHDRAEVLSERNRLAREVHDVLAHTLSALSVQMEALSSLIEDGAEREEIGDAAARSRRLVTEGLEETRRAVRVLRDEPVDVADQVSALSEEGVEVVVRGEPRRLSAAAGLALVRIAQEAVTNARKHATGAGVRIILTFGEGAAELTVDNDSSKPSELGSTGAGYGLQGMRERLELAGGSLTAGPTKTGWRVHAQVMT